MTCSLPVVSRAGAKFRWQQHNLPAPGLELIQPAMADIPKPRDDLARRGSCAIVAECDGMDHNPEAAAGKIRRGLRVAVAAARGGNLLHWRHS
jgi:hypothetical protein